MSETPEQLRWRVLALLVPHLCHKVNNGLGVVQGLSEVLLRRAGDERDHPQLTAIFQGASGAAELISRVGDFVAPVETRRELCDVAVAVRASAALAQPLFRDTGGKLELRIGEGAFVCMTNARRLMQVLVVLAAAPYARQSATRRLAPERLRLALVRSGDQVVLRLSHADLGPEREAETTAALESDATVLGARVESRAMHGWRSRRIVFS